MKKIFLTFLFLPFALVAQTDVTTSADIHAFLQSGNDAAGRTELGAESNASNDIDPDRLNGDTTDDNLIDPGIVGDLSANYHAYTALGNDILNNRITYTTISADDVIDSTQEGKWLLIDASSESIELTHSDPALTKSFYVQASAATNAITIDDGGSVTILGGPITIPAGDTSTVLYFYETNVDNTWAFFDPRQYKVLPISASAMIPRTTNGPEASTEESTTNNIMQDLLLFDGATEEGAQISFPFFADWDRGSLYFLFFWEPATGASAADGVTWGVAAQAIGNDDAIDTAFPASVDTDDTVIAVGDRHVTATSAAVTVSGTPTLHDKIHIEFTRVVGDANDTMTEDAKLGDVYLYYRSRVDAVASP